MADKKQAFEKLVEDHKGIIYRICNSFCHEKDDRDDLAQEILYNLWKAYSTYTPDYKLSTWIYRVAMNVAISYYRKEKRALQFHPYSETIMEFEMDDNPNDHEEKVEMLYQFIHELKEVDKSVLILYLEDKSHREIAEIIGISETNVGTKINRIKERLKQQFTLQKK